MTTLTEMVVPRRLIKRTMLCVLDASTESCPLGYEVTVLEPSVEQLTAPATKGTHSPEASPQRNSTKAQADGYADERAEMSRTPMTTVPRGEKSIPISDSLPMV